VSGQSWPAEETARLAALWEQGIPSGRIAKLLGRTRSSVICRAHRMKLTPRPKSAPALPRLVDTPAAGPRSRPGPAPPRKPLVWLPPSGAVHMCQWPEGEPKTPGFRFCGAPAASGRPYCLRHCRIAFVGFGHRTGASYTFGGLS
jgi:GcrA cell cycle regulator